MCLDPKCLTRIHARGNLTYDGRKGVGMSWNILNLASSASLPGGTFSYTWLSDGTKVSARADDGSGHGVQKRYFGSFVFTSNTGISSGMIVPGNIYFVKHQSDILEKVYLRNNIKS